MENSGNFLSNEHKNINFLGKKLLDLKRSSWGHLVFGGTNLKLPRRWIDCQVRSSRFDVSIFVIERRFWYVRDDFERLRFVIHPENDACWFIKGNVDQVDSIGSRRHHWVFFHCLSISSFFVCLTLRDNSFKRAK